MKESHAAYTPSTPNKRSLTDIADRLNFKFLSHFSRYFSAKVGMTPTQYRLSLTK